MKFAPHPLTLLALALAFARLPCLATDTVPLRFLSPAVTVTEADSFARLQVIRAEDANHPITVDFLTQPISATQAADYTPVAGTLIFAPGEHFKLIEIPILNDGSTEIGETFRVVLTNASQGEITETFGSAIITIRDNDPGFSFETVVYSSGETQSEVVLNVRRGSDRPGKISVNYAVEADTATSGTDYLPVSGTLSFDPNGAIQTIRVPILRDFIKEPVETFRVVLSHPSGGASLGNPSTATVRLLDNDPGFRFAFSNYTVSESQGEALFYVDRGTDLPGELSVEYSLEPISAAPDLDYTPVRGTLIFSAGQFSGMVIRVPILKDELKEPVESFRVLLSNPSAGAHLGAPSVATVRIENNDTGFSFAGGSSYSFSEDGKVFLTVNRGSEMPVESVDYAVEPVSATPDLDFTPVSGRLVFTAENSSATIEVPILNDQLKEATETFRVRLSNASPGSSLGTPSVATIRILDNDSGFSFGSSNYSAYEASGVNLSVHRGTDPMGETSVDFSVEAGSAIPGLDYTPVSGKLTFRDKEASKVIHIPIMDDTLQETVETFRVILSNPGLGSSIGSPGTVTVRISDNDPGFSFEGSTSSFVEGSAEAALTVYRGSNSTNEARVDYSVEPNTATPELDYTPVRGTLVFAAQDISKSISVPILNDMISEGTESFSVVLTNPSAGASLGTRNRANVRIQDDDVGFVFECTPYCGTGPEHSGAATVDVVIRGDFKLTSPVSIDFVTEPARATANLDFLAISGTLTFAPGETRKTVSIPLINDGLFEPDETFRIVLLNPVGLAQVGALPRFTFTIQDNERGYWIEANTENGHLILPQRSGDVLINIHRVGDFNYSSSVDFRTSEPGERGSTASPGHHFVAAAGRITFAPGETNKAITLRLIDTRRARLVERFFIELSNPTGGIATGDGLRWLEIPPRNERNPLRVDPNFRSEVRYSGSGGGDVLQVLPDGRIVMATPLEFLTGEDGRGIVRLLQDGTLDPSFTLARTSGFNLLALQTNGQVLVGGDPEFTINGSTVRRLARLNADGSFDSTFLAQLPGFTYPSVTAVAAQPDGKILVAANYDLLVRLNPDGSLDSSFPAMANVPISRIVLDKRGRALISGDFGIVQNEGRPGLARVLSDGSLDRSFLGDWQLGPIHRFELEAEGTVLITYSDENWVLQVARLTQDGRIDPTFQADARLGSFHQIGEDSFGPSYLSVLPAPDRKVFVSEQKDGGSGGSGLSGILSRLNSDGSLDDSFPTGTLIVSFHSSAGWGPFTYSLTTEAAGDLLIKGHLATVNGTPTAGLGRLLINGGSPPVTVDPASAQILETNGFVNVTLVRTGNTSGAYSVNWATESGTALPGVDFLAASGTVIFAPGESDRAIPLQLIDNQQLDGDRTLRLRLTLPDGTVLPSVTIAIVNDDRGFVPGGSYAFPNGRFLMTLTGGRARTNYRIERSTDLLFWENWIETRDPQIIDRNASTENGTRQFYRLIGD